MNLGDMPNLMYWDNFWLPDHFQPSHIFIAQMRLDCPSKSYPGFATHLKIEICVAKSTFCTTGSFDNKQLGGTQFSPICNAFAKLFAFFALNFSYFQDKIGKKESYLPCTDLQKVGYRIAECLIRGKIPFSLACC